MPVLQKQMYLQLGTIHHHHYHPHHHQQPRRRPRPQQRRKQPQGQGQDCVPVPQWGCAQSGPAPQIQKAKTEYPSAICCPPPPHHTATRSPCRETWLETGKQLETDWSLARNTRCSVVFVVFQSFWTEGRSFVTRQNLPIKLASKLASSLRRIGTWQATGDVLLVWLPFQSSWTEGRWQGVWVECLQFLPGACPLAIFMGSC